jgi:transporter family-2 protein
LQIRGQVSAISLLSPSAACPVFERSTRVQLLMLGLAAVAGLTMAVQGSLNAALSKVTGLFPATLVVHVLGTILTAIAVVFHIGDGNLAKITAAPWYTYLGGVLNVLIIAAVAVTIPRLGAASATTAIIVGQVLTALCIDQLGCFGLNKVPFTWTKLLGLALLAAGAWLLLNVKR